MQWIIIIGDKLMDIIAQEKFQELYENHIDYLATEGQKGKRMVFNKCIIWWNLENANLSKAVFRNCQFYSCSFVNCKFYDCYFINCNFANSLFFSDFTDTYFENCNFHTADLSCAQNFDKAKFYGYNHFLALQCPEEGSFIGWKIAETTHDYYILKLEIPADAKRSSATSRKCRASKAKVLEIQTLGSKPAKVKKVNSIYHKHFTYSLGETYEVKDFDDNRWRECSTGIHFYLTRDEVIDFYKHTILFD